MTLQTLGAGLGPDREEGGTGGVEHKIIPWGYSVYRQVPSVAPCHESRVVLQTPCHDMVTNLGGVTITQAMSYAIDWEAAFRYTQDAPEVVVQMLLSRRAEMTEVM